MTNRTLVIGNKNYSSWSLRPWLAMRVAGIPFEEKLIPLLESAPGFDWKAEITAISGAGRVPILLDDGVKIWESLAILEYLAEKFPEANLWPTDPLARATARAVAAEMHAGFTSLRNTMPMNIRKSLPGRGMTPETAKDIDRVQALWTHCRQTFGADGAFLFGAFGAADAMFAPVASRLRTYDVTLTPLCAEYQEAVLSLPAFIDWATAGRDEPWIIVEDEVA
ncbi:MAG: glutathione S-transferase family protein [Magnetospiraceae bacterium]